MARTRPGPRRGQTLAEASWLLGDVARLGPDAVEPSDEERAGYQPPVPTVHVNGSSGPWEYVWARTGDPDECNYLASEGWRVVPGVTGPVYDGYPSVLMERAR